MGDRAMALSRPSILRFVPAAVWASLIFALSHRSKLPEPPISFEGLDKVVHAVFFAILTGLMLWADKPSLSQANTIKTWRPWLWATLAMFYGVVDEWHQSFVPGRSPDVFDVIADAVGALVATAVVVMRLPRTSKA